MKRTEIERLLPEVFQRTICEGGPLFALLEVMYMLHEPSQAVLDSIDAAFDPRRASSEMVAFLARWVDLERFFDESAGGKTASPLRQQAPTGLARLRELVAIAAYLTKWRGTAKGLLLFLETATGERGFEIQEQVADADGRARAFHLRVIAPSITTPDKILIERIVEFEKPAYVTYELEFR
jgi:phage tail-like protein